MRVHRTISFVIAATLVLQTAARSMPVCIDYAEHLRWTGIVHRASPYDIGVFEIVDGFVHSAGSVGYGIAALDGSIGPVGLPTSHAVLDVAVAKQHAYLACGAGGLVAVDISDRRNPVVVSTLQLKGWFTGVKHHNGYLYVAFKGLARPDGRLFVYEVRSAPGYPQSIGATRTPFRPESIHFDGRVYIRDVEACEVPPCRAGFGIYDVSNVGEPREVGYISTGANSTIRTRDGFAFLSSTFAGFQIYDVRDPGAFRVGPSFFSVQGEGVAVSRDGNVFAASEDGLVTIDVSRPHEARVVGRVGVPMSLGMIRLDGDVGYAALGDDLVTFDAAHAVGVKPHQVIPFDHDVIDVVVDGKKTFVLDARGRVHILDLANIKAPVTLGTFGVSFAARLDAENDIVAVITQNPFLPLGSMAVFDVSKPAYPSLMGARAVTGPPRVVVVRGGRAFAGGHVPPFGPDEGLVQIFDVDTPFAPVPRGAISQPPWLIDDIAIVGSRLLTSDGYEFDVSDVTAPRFVRQLQAHGQTIEITGNRIYAGTRDLSVLDSTGVLLHGIILPDLAQDLLALDGYLYVACGVDGVLVYDADDPGVSIHVGSVNTPGFASKLALSPDERFVFVADGSAGLTIVPRQCPRTAPPHTVAARAIPPLSVTLRAPAPNPARGTTRVPFTLARAGLVRLAIFDASGRLVRVLVDETALGLGAHARSWDGRTGSGEPVAGGVYFAELRLTTPDGKISRASRRLVVTR